MITMAKAIREFVEAAGRPVTADEIKEHINREYSGQWRPSTLQGHLYGCVVNNAKAYVHHPSAVKFLYRRGDGTFEIYSEKLHGENVWAPPDDDADEELEELAVASIGLERDLEDHLVHHLDSIETGLTLVGRQESTDVGRTDILAEDVSGRRVIIEVKVGEARDSAVGQIARYLGWFQRNEGSAPRGILIAADFPEGVRYAATVIPDLQLISYKVHFTFSTVSV